MLRCWCDLAVSACLFVAYVIVCVAFVMVCRALRLCVASLLLFVSGVVSGFVVLGC